MYVNILEIHEGGHGISGWNTESDKTTLLKEMRNTSLNTLLKEMREKVLTYVTRSGVCRINVNRDYISIHVQLIQMFPQGSR